MGLVGVQSGGGHVKAVFPVFDMLLAVPFKFDFPVHQQRGLFQGSRFFPDFALFHAEDTEVHEHIGVSAVHFRQPFQAEGMRAMGFDDAIVHFLTPRRFR